MLILASASPRRQELLRHAGIAFVVHAADVDERVLDGELPEACAMRLARAKALAVAVAMSGLRPEDWVLGADTIVVAEVGGVAESGVEEILGKPRDTADAARMLRLLAGRTHRVVTGVCLIRPGGAAIELLAETTQVTMTAIREAEIAAYVASGEPMDKAGAYAIQGRASRWVVRLEGCYFNVVGLPVARVVEMLGRAGYSV